MHAILAWVAFNLLIVALLLLDLFVLQKKHEASNLPSALKMTGFWISLALLFNLGVWISMGKDSAVNFFTGYILEYSLSIDNIFVFILIFAYFSIPLRYQHKVLFWGIIGAQVMRATFVLAGVSLIQKFEWIIYIFGAFLIYTGIKLTKEKEEEFDPDKSPIFSFIKRIIPTTSDYEDDKFFVKRDARWLATPLFLVLVIVDVADIIFAVDSIPAILAITTNSFIVYTSNMFAILGLRTLYFALASLMRLFHYLNYGLAFILIFVGVKMLISHFYHVPVLLALGVILGILLVSILASILFPPKEKSH